MPCFHGDVGLSATLRSEEKVSAQCTYVNGRNTTGTQERLAWLAGLLAENAGIKQQVDGTEEQEPNQPSSRSAKKPV